MLPKNTVHRQHQKRSEEAAKEIKEDYISNRSKCVVHRDEKLLPGVSGQTGQVDRLPALLTSLEDGCTKLLGVPKFSSSADQNTSNAIIAELHSSQCNNQVIGMCFDTTASNTGRQNGACTLLEIAYDRDLVWLACRHYMFIVLLADVFKVCLGPFTGPEILLFKRFRDNWMLFQHEIQERETPSIAATGEVVFYCGAIVVYSSA